MSFSRILFWINNARHVALPQSLLPAVVALACAWREPAFHWLYALLALVGIAMAHLSFNLFDDYFDYRKSSVNLRDRMASSGMRARIGKCNYITSGKATVKQLLRAALIFGAIAFALGVAIFLYRGFPILIFVAIALSLGLFYSAPPFRLSYHGLGEVVIATVFGPLLMGGIYYAAAGTVNNSLWFISIPVGLLIANIIFTHDIMDFEVDKKLGKKTLCVIINNQFVNLLLSAFFIFIPYLLIICGCLFHFLSPWILLTLLTLPQAIALHYLLWQFVKNPQQKFTPKWWMQPMERWEAIKEAGIDWFMIRWYLSRNLLTLFCLMIIIMPK